MQAIALAQTLARHRAARTPPTARMDERPAPAARHSPILMAISRQAHLKPRTMMEMARDRDGMRRPWQ